ncbi:MAG: hypothetical protein GY777_14030 [Candidatus Brocadiaceae bacterium]|nr:hypothetical protein [Candidatus Brocadiaceae bacterium]
MSENGKGRLATWIPIVIAILGFAAGGGWLQVYMESNERGSRENQKLVAEYLAPINILLTDNKAIYDRLYEKHTVDPWGILESYVNRVNQSPPYKQLSLMRTDIATMSSNNSEIVGLLKSYSGYVLTDNFLEESATFRKHAVEWNNRWAAVPEVIKAGIQLPYAEPFPQTFPIAVKRELDARSE